MIAASQLQSGMIVGIDGQLFRVLECSAKAGGGQLGGTVKTKLQNTSSGRFSEPHFRPDQRIEDLQVERHVMEFLYADSDSLYLMNPETYEQIQISRSSIGGADRFLTAGMQVGVEFFQGLPISLIPPTVVHLLVADTAPPSHSGQDSTWKPARLENEIEIRVPMFFGKGDVVRIDTHDGHYMERVRADKKRLA